MLHAVRLVFLGFFFFFKELTAETLKHKHTHFSVVYFIVIKQEDSTSSTTACVSENFFFFWKPSVAPFSGRDVTL